MIDCRDECGDGIGAYPEGLRVKALVENVPLVVEFVAQCARAAGFDDQALYQIQLAVDEACANVVHHAYKGMVPGDMEVWCCLEDRSLTIRVRDWGRSFDPETVAEPDINAPLEERTCGGLGLFLMKQVMDRVQFVFDPERGNELLLVKRRR